MRAIWIGGGLPYRIVEILDYQGDSALVVLHIGNEDRQCRLELRNIQITPSKIVEVPQPKD